MEDRSHSLRAPLREAEVHPSTRHSHHTFTFANGIKRIVSRRDEMISCTPDWIWREAQKQLHLAGPMLCVALLQYLLIVVAIMFVGHLGELELAGASIASSFASVSGTSVVIGMASALDTLCDQAFGAKQYHLLGLYLQRAILVNYLVCIPISLIWWNMDFLLVSLGQNPEIANLAGLCSRNLIPTAFAVATVQPLLKFLQAQSVVRPMALSSAVALLLHIPLCWLLIFHLHIGLRGAAIATSASSWLNVAFLAL